MIDSAVSMTSSILESARSGDMTVSSSDLTSLVSTFNMVSAEHVTNVNMDVSSGNTEFSESSSSSTSTDTTTTDSSSTTISDGDTTITASSETETSTSTEVSTTTTSAAVAAD